MKSLYAYIDNGPSLEIRQFCSTDTHFWDLCVWWSTWYSATVVMFQFCSSRGQSVALTLSVIHSSDLHRFILNLCIYSVQGSKGDDPLLWTVITWPGGDIALGDALWTQHICTHFLSIMWSRESSVRRGAWMFSLCNTPSARYLIGCKYCFDTLVGGCAPCIEGCAIPL